MAEKQVLQEFLAVLGFQVSQPTFKSFMNSLGLACKSAGKLTAGLVGVAVAAETMVTVFAKNMEKFFYLSQRTNAPVAALRALAFGFGQVGLSGEEALDTIDEFAKRLRYEPGKAALLKSLGVDTSEQDPTKMFKSLLLQLRAMTQAGAGFVAVQWAEQFGISEKVFNRLMQPGAIEALGQAQRKASGTFKSLGIDQQAAAKASRDFMNELRELWFIVETIGAKFAIDLLPYVKQFNEVILEFGRDLVKSGLSVAFDNLLDKLGSFGAVLKRIKDASMPILESMGRAIAQFAEDFAKFGLSGAIDKSLLKMGSLGQVLQVVKDLVESLPMLPAVIAEMMDDLFGTNHNNPSSTYVEKRPTAAVGEALAHPINFMGDWLKSAYQLSTGASSETFAPKPAWSVLPGATQWAAMQQERANSQFTQNVQVHVASTDPHEAGRVVVGEIKRSASDLARMHGSVPR